MTSPSTISKRGAAPANVAAKTAANSSRALGAAPSPSSLSQASSSSQIPSHGNSESMSRNGSVTSSFGDYFTAAATTGPSASSSLSKMTNDVDNNESHQWTSFFSTQEVPPTPAAAAKPDVRFVHTPLLRSAGSDTMMKNGTTADKPAPAFPLKINKQNTFATPLGSSQSITPGSSLSSSKIDLANGATEAGARYNAIVATELETILLPSTSTSGSSSSSRRSETLILDIRPSTAFAMARIHGSINICAPSTLLRRSGVTIERIEDEMLQNEDDRARFSGWRKGPIRETDGGRKASASGIPASVHSIQSIVVLDTDTRNIGDAGKPSSGGGGLCLTGLLKKFDLAGYDGQLRWLVGGFNDFVQHAVNSDKAETSSLIDRDPLAASENKDAKGGGMPLNTNGADSARRASAPDVKGLLGRPGMRLPPIQSARSYSLVQPKGLPMEAFMARSTAQGKAQEVLNNNAVQYATAGEASSQGSEEPNLSAANPFFDNIRQNKELQNGVTERIPLSVPDMSEREAMRLPGFLNKLRRMPSAQRASTLAQSFFEIEQQERDRLMAVMQRHAEESDGKRQARGVEDKGTHSVALTPVQLLQLSSQHCSVSPGNVESSGKHSFPFSIAAALERGSENRYNNIWTYEHSRVRCPMSSEYLNGSYVEPARQFGCLRRYIATQAPLPATFDTFWSVMWQQNVRTICMVTREFESGRVQSHNYWSKKQYGPLTLEVIEDTALDKHGNAVSDVTATEDKPEEPGNYFGTNNDRNNVKRDNFASIRRRFVLTNQEGESRTITQFQYIEWPDYSVPDDADQLLVLMRLANASQHASGGVGPLVVHCSAGVGRTGTYVAIDSALDCIRRARRASAGRPALDVWDQGWTVKHERGRERDTSPSQQQPSTQIEQFQFAVSSVKSPPEFTASTTMHRKNLKRELSPSAMDLDSPQRQVITGGSVSGGSTFDNRVRSSSPASEAPSIGRDIDSPPPARRSRPDEVDEAHVGGNGSIGKSTTNSQSGHLPFSLGSIDGPQTPSSALSRLSLLSAGGGSASTVSPMPLYHPHPGDSGSGASVSSLLSGASNKMSHDSSTSAGTTALTHISDASPDDVARLVSTHADIMDANDGVDVVRKIADTIREQRMSMIQTTRQFVFAYAAVFQGVLEEMRREEAALERRLSLSS